MIKVTNWLPLSLVNILIQTYGTLTMSITNSRENNFDFLRVLAACFVAFSHSFALLGMDDKEWLVANTWQQVHVSFLGLSIFFTISGYLIAKSLYTSTSITSYIWKRFLRIQPLLIAMCLLVVFVLGPIFTTLPLYQYFSSFQTYLYFKNVFPLFGIEVCVPGVFAKNPIAYGINGSIWTLVVEERLYILLIPVYYYRKYTKIFFIALVLSCNLAHIYLRFYTVSWPTQYFFIFLDMYPIMFLNGSLLYFIHFDFDKYRKYLFPVSFALSFASLCFSQLFWIQILVIPIAILYICLSKGPFTNISRFGDFTYCIYLFSYIVQQILIAKGFFLTNPFGLFLATIGICFAMAIPSWHLFEKRILSYKALVK